MLHSIDVYELGATGDGATDDTKPLQDAIDLAVKTGRSVELREGRFLCGVLYMKPNVHIRGNATWGYRRDSAGQTVILQRDSKQNCQIDMTTSNGVTLDGLSLLGNNSGNCAGLLSCKPNYGAQEDAYRIENCRVANYTSHAVFLDHIWCFSVRHCMFAFCGGDGLRINGWDGFVIDNWFSGNRGAGFGTEGPNASVTMTGNRIEWNARGGIVLDGGSHYNITGNYIDRSGSAGISLTRINVASATGNVIYRSGKFQPDTPDSAQVILDGCSGIVFSGNTMNAGRDDGDKGDWTPNYALRVHNLKDCAVTSNVMFRGGMTGLLDDRGGHENSLITDNVGSVAVN
jgi:hypothetical protein